MAVEVDMLRYPPSKLVSRDYHEDFELKEVIGRGGYGHCRLVRDPDTRRYFAAKVIPVSNYNKTDKKYIENEVSLQSSLKHKNVVQLHKVYAAGGRVVLITELCIYGNLNSLLTDSQMKLGDPEKRNIIHGVLTGTNYLHEKGIVHGDIKPLNVFIAKGLVAKLGDFGMAHYEKEYDSMGSFGGTLNYYSPEVFSQQRHTTKSDIWAIGCTGYFTYSGEELFPTNLKTRQVKRLICSAVPPLFRTKLRGEPRNFLSLLLLREPERRPTCRQLLRHSFLLKRISRTVSKNVLTALAPYILDPKG